MKNGVRLFGHRVHPALSDFPLVLLFIAPIADLTGWIREEPHFWVMGFWCLCAGLASAIPTATTGFIDFATLPRDSKQMTTAVWHMGAMLSAVSLSGLSLAFRRGQIPDDASRMWIVALETAGALVLIVGGWLGGHLVFHHAIGVERTKPE